MKYKRLTALVLAAALVLAGCGGTKSSSGSAAASQSTGSSQNAPALATQKERITEQFTLEKTVRNEWGSAQKLTIHVPQLVCDSPDAAYLNDELAAMYAADFRQYEDSPEIEPQQDEWSQEIYINWDAYWYGDCVSLVMFRYDGGSDPGYSRGWCFDFATDQQVSVAEMLQRMGLDPDAVQQQVLRQAMQTMDRDMAQGGYYEGLRSGGNLASMRMNTLENNQLEDLCLLLPEQNRLVLRGGCSSTAGCGWRQLDVEIPLTPAAPADTPVLTDTYGSASVQLEGTQGTITLRRTPETAAWAADYGIRLEQDHAYPILGIYNEYIDLCIGELGASFHPVVYLLTKDGVVEYVDVLHCLMFGSALVCQDPIYIANQGVALERSGSEVNLRQEDGSVLELAPLTAEWNAQELPSEAVGAFNDMGDDQFDWMDVESNGSVQMGVQDNSVFYQGYADYLGVVPEGMVLGVWTNETADGAPGITFVAAMKYDLYNETLNLDHDRRAKPLCRGKDPAAADPLPG